MKFKTIKLKISGMTCEHCAETIMKKVNKLNGIIYNSVKYPENKGEFKYDPGKITVEAIIAAINSTAHYRVVGEIKEDLIVSEEKSITQFDFDLIIIGGGSAAFAAAIKASELGKKVLMINEGLPIGGTCVNVGCIPSKILIRAAEQIQIIREPNFAGISNNKPEVDFKEIIRQKNKIVEELQTQKYINVLKDDKKVRIIKGYGKVTGSNTVEVNKEKFTARYILIASGASTFVPEVKGLDKIKYLTNETLYSLKELPEKLIILGGRYIALENAQLFARLGSQVTVLQRSFRILPDEMPDLTENLKEFLESEGIKIKTGVKLNSVEYSEGNILLRANIKGTEETFEGTHLFVATGRKGNTTGFGLENIGLRLYGNNFIKTDDFLQTSIPTIYAAGDVTGEYLFVYSAAYEGALAVGNMFSENKKKKDYSVFPWVIFTDPQVAGVGMDENIAYKNNIDYEVSTIWLKDIPRSIAAKNMRGFIKIIRSKKNNKILGARILAPEGSELLMEISIAIKWGITVTELKELFHPYLTLSEGIKLALIGFDKDLNKLSCCAV